MGKIVLDIYIYGIIGFGVAFILLQLLVIIGEIKDSMSGHRGSLPAPPRHLKKVIEA